MAGGMAQRELERMVRAGSDGRPRIERGKLALEEVIQRWVVAAVGVEVEVIDRRGLPCSVAVVGPEVCIDVLGLAFASGWGLDVPNTSSKYWIVGTIAFGLSPF